MNTELAAVVVTYHPDAAVLENLSAARAQVAAMVVVDNGSSAEELLPLRKAARTIGFTLIENAENLGIATALNQGVREALGARKTMLLLLDQDSCVTEGYVQAMLGCFAAHPLCERLAILVPRYVDRRFGAVLAPPLHGGALEAATTSGSLMPAGIFAAAGYFADEMFIDGVDYEYSLRVRRLGYGIAECGEATLLHSPGTPTYHRVLGLKPFQAANYSPVRRYYQERNKIWAARRYLRAFPAFCLRQFAISAKDLLKIVLVEQDKGRKLRYFFRGVLHGLQGRTGPMPQG